MATADEIYTDPSALACLYLHQHERSRRMVAWRAGVQGALPVTHHGKTEIVNAVCLAVFRGELDEQGMELAIGDLESDFLHGHLRQADVLWRAALNRAVELSRAHTPRLGTRALDVIHVACALELKARHFLTFDERQQKLASASGLKIIKL